jgi:hypothetical protein
MNSLQKKIKHVELELEQNRFILNNQYHLLKKDINTSRFLSLAIMSSFAIGYLFARKKSKVELIFAASAATLTARRIYKNIQLIFPAFII